MPSVPRSASEPAETPRSKTCSTVAAGQPASSVMPSPTWAWVNCRGTAAATPSAPARSSASCGLTPPYTQAPVSSTRSPRNSLSKEWLTDHLPEAANTVIPPTSATPIISADAVAAVRRGLRSGVLPGQLPADRRSAGAARAPRTRTTGRASTGLSVATPRNPASAPSSTIGTVPLVMPPSTDATLPATRTRPMHDPPPRRPGALHRDRAHGLDRRDPGGPAGRQQGRHHGDRDAEREGDDQRRRAHDQRTLRHASRRSSRQRAPDALGHADAGEQAERRRQRRRRRPPRSRRCGAPAWCSRRSPAAARARGSAARPGSRRCC